MTDDEIKASLRIKYLPFEIDDEHIERYKRYLSLSDADMRPIIAAMSDDDYECWVSVQTAHAMYTDPLDRMDGSITPEKVARHPERYGLVALEVLDQVASTPPAPWDRIDT